jgi:hypothetical protein
MKNRLVVFSLLYAIIFCASISAEPESDEPVELARLKEQFKKKIDIEMKPWRDKYAQELQKLEDRLVRERKLIEALAVKKEKENYMLAKFESQQVKDDAIKDPVTEQEAKKAIQESVWLVYSADDDARDKMLDMYYFLDAKQVFLMSSKATCSWTVISKNEIVISMPQGPLSLKIDMSNSSANAKLANQSYKMFYVGKSTR